MKRKGYKSLFPVRWTLIFYDILIFAAVIAFALLLYRGHNLKWWQILLHFVSGVFISCTARFFWRVYGQIWRYGGVQSYLRLMFADSCFFLIYFLVQRFVPNFGSIPFPVVSLIVFANTIISLAIRMVYRFLYKRINRSTKSGQRMVRLINFFAHSDWTVEKGDPVNKIRIAIIGAGVTGTGLAEELINNPTSAYTPVCFVDIDKEKLGR